PGAPATFACRTIGASGDTRTTEPDTRGRGAPATRRQPSGALVVGSPHTTASTGAPDGSNSTTSSSALFSARTRVALSIEKAHAPPSASLRSVGASFACPCGPSIAVSYPLNTTTHSPGPRVNRGKTNRTPRSSAGDETASASA